MPAVSGLPIGVLLARVAKRDYTGENGDGASGHESPLAIVGLVVAALTLIVGIAAPRSSRTRRWASHLLPSLFVKKTLDITLPDPAPTAIPPTVDLHSTPFAQIPVPAKVFVYNDYSSVHPDGTHSDIFPYVQGGISGGYGRAPRVGELLVPRRPEPVVGGRIQWR